MPGMKAATLVTVSGSATTWTPMTGAASRAATWPDTRADIAAVHAVAVIAPVASAPPSRAPHGPAGTAQRRRAGVRGGDGPASIVRVELESKGVTYAYCTGRRRVDA